MNEASLSETHDFDKIPPVNKELNSMSEDVQETSSSTPNFKTELAQQLQQLVPEAIADGKVDVAKLKELLGNDADDGSERFGLFWPGKLRAIRAAQEPTTATLAPEPEKSKDWDTTKNVFIEGDNLESLKILQKYYHGKIKMIYIDPPYNTGHDFIYPDNYQEGLKTYLEWTKQVNEEGQKVSSNSESDGRYHSHWLNMMYPRLKLARSLLSDDGVVFISIDDNEQANLKKMCDEIFGENNFIGVIVRKTKMTSNKGTFFSQSHEYILTYARSIEKTEMFNDSEAQNSEKYTKLFRNEDSRGRYNIVSLYMPSLPNADERPNSRYGIKTPDGTTVFPPHNRIYRWKEETFLENLADDRVVFKETKTSPLVDIDGNQSKWNIYTKLYLHERQKSGMLPLTILDRYPNSEASKELIKLDIPFAFSKPKGLIVHLMKIIGAHDDALILDFFAGSGTTAHAVMQLNAEDGGNRRYIQVQLPEPTGEKSEAYKAGYHNISDISRERIDRAGEKIKQDYAEKLAKRDAPLDVGYRTYKLTDTNFAKWRESSSTDQGTLEQHLLDLRDNANDDATELALLTEVLLKQGYSLTEQVEQQIINDLRVWSIGDNNLALAYMDERVKPTLEQLRALVDREPEKLIVLEDAFQGDDELKTNLVQAAKTKHVELWTA